MRFAQFFLGTPQRLLATIGCLVILYGVFNLDQVAVLFDRLLAVVINHVLPLVIVVAIIIYAFQKIIGKK